MSIATNDEINWQQTHRQLTELAARRAGLDAEEGALLLRALRSSVHERLGYGSFQEYVERLFGYGPRFVVERLRVAQALETLPELTGALVAGEISMVGGARAHGRVATLETERAWLSAGRGKTLRQLENLVSGLPPGALPGEPARRELQRHVLHLEVSAETFATYREALGKLRRQCGEPLDEEALLLLMARQVLVGSSDQGRANYQVAMTLCESCGEGRQQGRGEAVLVSPEVSEMAGGGMRRSFRARIPTWVQSNAPPKRSHRQRDAP